MSTLLQLTWAPPHRHGQPWFVPFPRDLTDPQDSTNLEDLTDPNRSLVLSDPDWSTGPDRYWQIFCFCILHIYSRWRYLALTATARLPLIQSIKIVAQNLHTTEWLCYLSRSVISDSTQVFKNYWKELQNRNGSPWIEERNQPAPDRWTQSLINWTIRVKVPQMGDKFAFLWRNYVKVCAFINHWQSNWPMKQMKEWLACFVISDGFPHWLLCK